MARPRSVNRKIPDLPRGMRKVRKSWHWRGTDRLTKEIQKRLQSLGISLNAGDTPNKARLWWERNVSPALASAAPADGVEGTVEEIVLKYEADELPTFKRDATKDEYEGRIRRIRAAFAAMRYPKTEAEALSTKVLRPVTITKHLHDNRHRASSANKDIQLLSRMFRLARVRWGLSTYNPCESIEYLPESPRDKYVDDDMYREIYDAAGPVLKCMLEISSQTGARIGMIRDIQIQDFDATRIVIRVSKKRNERGYESKSYDMTPDLWQALCKGMELRKSNRGGAKCQPSDFLFITKQGKPYTKDSFRSLWRTVRIKLELEPREITFHDMRAKAASDSESDGAAQELLHHKDAKTTKRVYRRKIPTSTPLPSAIKGR